MAVFPASHPETAGRHQVNYIKLADDMSVDFGLVPEDTVSIQFEHFRRAKAILFDSADAMLKSRDEFVAQRSPTQVTAAAAAAVVSGASGATTGSEVALSLPPLVVESTSPQAAGNKGDVGAVRFPTVLPPSDAHRVRCFERDWVDVHLEDVIKRDHIAKVKAAFFEQYANI